MNSAEFKMMRRLLGISTDEVAATFHVALRSARRWESTHQPPEAVVQWMQDKLTQAHVMVEDLVQQSQRHDAAMELSLYRTDAAATQGLGSVLTKEQHTAIVGLASFLVEHDLYSAAGQNQQGAIRVEFADE